MNTIIIRVDRGKAHPLGAKRTPLNRKIYVLAASSTDQWTHFAKKQPNGVCL